MKATPQAVSDALTRAYARVSAMYRAGEIATDDLSMNFLMDRSVENWREEFARLKSTVGMCSAEEPLTATGLLSGTFAWHCEHGVIRGTLELSPTNPPRLQSLVFREEAEKPH